MQPQSINENPQSDLVVALEKLEAAVQEHARQLQAQNNVLIFRPREERQAKSETL